MKRDIIDATLITLIIAFIFAVGGWVNEISKTNKTAEENSQIESETIHQLTDDLNTLVHYPESQKAHSIIHRVRLNAAIDEAMIIVDEAENE